MRNKLSISKFEIEELRKAGEAVVLIDVRTAAEFHEKHIPGALNISGETIESGGFLCAESEPVIVFACGKGGGRSERAAAYLNEYGGYNARFLEGGTLGWDDVLT